MMLGFLSRRCSTAWAKQGTRKKYISCQWKLLFPLAFNICNKEANTTLSFEYGATDQSWIPSISNIHWFNTIFRINNLCITLYFSPTEYFSVVLMGLLSGPCSLLLPDVQTTHQVWPLHLRFLRTTLTHMFVFHGLKVAYHLAKFSSSTLRSLLEAHGTS